MPLLRKNQSAYFKHAVEELIDQKIDTHFVRKRFIDDDGERCAGYFDHYNKELKVAIWSKDWFNTFIHEFNHFKQWREQTPMWMEAEDLNFLEDYKKRYLLATQLMEQECDKMAWHDIKKWGIEGEKNYIACANAYHISYVNIANNKKWLKRGPYRFKDVWKLCPNDRFFSIKELANPDKKLYDLINKRCF